MIGSIGSLCFRTLNQMRRCLTVRVALSAASAIGRPNRERHAKGSPVDIDRVHALVFESARHPTGYPHRPGTLATLGSVPSPSPAGVGGSTLR